MSEAAFQRFVAPARMRARWWRMLAGLAVIVLGWLGWTALVLIAWMTPDLLEGQPIGAALQRLEGDFLSARPPVVAITLLTFFGIWPSVWLALRLVHRRGFSTLLAPERRVRFGDFGVGLGFAAVLWGAGTVVALALVGAPERSELSLFVWTLWIVPLAVLVFFQAGGEELIFRGYLLQNLAALSSSPWMWGILPTLVFAVMHYDASRTPAMNSLYVVTVLVFGLIAVLLVWRTGALWAGIGFHAGNNFGALTLTGLEGVTAGSQLFVHPEPVKEQLVLIDTLIMMLMLLWLMSPACPQRLRAA